MKKLFILMLVLGMPSAANATIEMAVDGEVVIETPKTEFELSVELTGGEISTFEIGFIINGGGVFDISQIEFPAFGDPWPIVIPVPGYDLFVSQSLFVPPVPAPATLVKGIMFSGGAVGDSIEMWDTSAGGGLIGTLTLVPACWFNPCQPYGDVNGDNLITGEDVGYLVRAWPEKDPCADFNHDGLITGEDIGILVGNWVEGCPNPD